MIAPIRQPERRSLLGLPGRMLGAAMRWGHIRTGYDAIRSQGKRKSPDGRLLSEDDELKPAERRRMLSGARDITRNFAIARFAVGKHLDYVSTFNFQAKTGDNVLDLKVDGLMNEWFKRENCDVAGRHNLHRFIRLAEARRTVDGDMGIVKLGNGQIQAIEGDRIRSPIGTPPGNWKPEDFYTGVRCDDYGKAMEYSICKRLGRFGAFKFERLVPASNMYLHAYFDRFDQTRGISPMASGLNSLRDTYENFDYALARAKISQLFGIKFTTTDEYGVSESLRHGVGSGVDEGDEGECEDDGPRHPVDWARSPIHLELDNGEDAAFIESHTPSTEFQAFSQIIIGVALKALDIPYSFYQENFSNYSGSRQALLMYEQSAACKRRDVKELLDELTRWRLGLFAQDGFLPGVNVEALDWEWIPAGLPWIDPEKEANAELVKIGGGLDNPENVSRRHGSDFYRNIDATKRCMEYAKAAGVPLSFVPQPSQPEPPPLPPTHGGQTDPPNQ